MGQTRTDLISMLRQSAFSCENSFIISAAMQGFFVRCAINGSDAGMHRLKPVDYIDY